MPECRVVAVESQLRDIADALRERGYRVVEPGQECRARAVVLSSRPPGATGTGGVPLVLPAGRPAGEVADEVDRRYPTTAAWASAKSTGAGESHSRENSM
ncbi:MAG: YkuS family protein [bacterium]|nr:YkuS family protein [bacterium]